MGGGRGTRLHPLTQHRCKPAVPLAGKYRLVDIPISNCLNSGLNQIYLLSQFNTASLHRHIQESYKFDPFGGGFVDILSAEQTTEGDNWYQGTADAVRQNLIHFGARPDDLFLILSGDQLYRMNFNPLIRQHIESGAEATIAATTIPESNASAFGLMRVEEDLSIAEFVEKPKDPKLIEKLTVRGSLLSKLSHRHTESVVLASMGLYLFNASVLQEALAGDDTDFGREVIPSLLGKRKMLTYIFDGYWEDIGTVAAFYEANIKLTTALPPFNFFDEANRIYTHARFLPASKINRATIDRAIVADGCIISGAEIHESVIGIRSIVRENSVLDGVVMMGSDFFDLEEERKSRESGRPKRGVGTGCYIRHAIIDKNACIGDGAILDPEGLPEGYAVNGVFVRDGVLVVGKNSVVPAGFSTRES